MAQRWIQNAHLKKNKLHLALGIKPGTEIPMERLEEAKAKGGKMAKMAQFAINARSFKH